MQPCPLTFSFKVVRKSSTAMSAQSSQQRVTSSLTPMQIATSDNVKSTFLLAYHYLCGSTYIWWLLPMKFSTLSHAFLHSPVDIYKSVYRRLLWSLCCSCCNSFNNCLICRCLSTWDCNWSCGTALYSGQTEWQ